jgi:hypothetical protein
MNDLLDKVAVAATEMLEDNPKLENCIIEDIVILLHKHFPVLSDAICLAAGEQEVDKVRGRAEVGGGVEVKQGTLQACVFTVFVHQVAHPEVTVAHGQEPGGQSFAN